MTNSSLNFFLSKVIYGAIYLLKIATSIDTGPQLPLLGYELDFPQCPVYEYHVFNDQFQVILSGLLEGLILSLVSIPLEWSLPLYDIAVFY